MRNEEKGSLKGKEKAKSFISPPRESERERVSEWE